MTVTRNYDPNSITGFAFIKYSWYIPSTKYNQTIHRTTHKSFGKTKLSPNPYKLSIVATKNGPQLLPTLQTYKGKAVIVGVRTVVRHSLAKNFYHLISKK